MEDKKLLKLKYFIGHGWPIFPVYWLDDGQCSCGKADCKSPGKHPLVDRGFYSATIDETKILEWHSKWSQANWGMRTGDKYIGGSGVLVIDIDNKSDGFKTWDLLREENPAPIETVTVASGNGGEHLWFIYPDGLAVSSSQGTLGKGIDVRANEGYVLIPPSQTTGPYKFEINPDEVQLSSLPDWILISLDGGEKKHQHKQLPDIVDQGQRHQSLLTVAGSLRRVGLEADVIETTLENLRDQKFSAGDHPVTDEEIADVVDWIGDKEAEYGFTDLGNAERFLRDHELYVRYCFKWESWLIWDGKRWAVDDTAELIRRAHETVRLIYAEASNAKDEGRRKTIAAHAVRSEARSRIENMLHCAKPYLGIKPEDLDQNPMLLNVRNGTIDLKKGELLPHNRNNLITRYIDLDFLPRAECPEWEKFIDLVTGGDKELAYFIQKAVGYTLTGSTDEHCLFFLYGAGQNGKTTFLETIRRLLADYTTRIDIEAVMQGWNLGSAANPYVANMAGTRFVLASEIAENRKINESLIKDLTGSDAISARFLFSNPFTFIPQHKLWLYGNHKPKVGGTDWGFWRRMRVIPFSVTISDDIKKPMSEVMARFDAEMSGILSWAVLGSLLWQNEELDMAPAVKNATVEYRTEQDLLQQFLDEKCELHPDYQAEKDKLFTAWRNWCEDAGEEQARRRSKKWLTRQLTGRGFNHGGDGNRFLLGVRLL
jgi:putative DNA primase/helicase